MSAEEMQSTRWEMKGAEGPWLHLLLWQGTEGWQKSQMDWLRMASCITHLKCHFYQLLSSFTIWEDTQGEAEAQAGKGPVILGAPISLNPMMSPHPLKMHCCFTI